MPSVKFNWLRKKSFGMYSALSAGVMFASISTNEIALRRSALQILNLYEWNIEGGKDKNLIFYLGF